MNKKREMSARPPSMLSYMRRANADESDANNNNNNEQDDQERREDAHIRSLIRGHASPNDSSGVRRDMAAEQRAIQAIDEQIRFIQGLILNAPDALPHHIENLSRRVRDETERRLEHVAIYHLLAEQLVSSGLNELGLGDGASPGHAAYSQNIPRSDRP